MQGDALAELLMQRLHHVKTAVLVHHVAQHRVEGLLLFSGGQGHRRAEHRVDKLPVDADGVFRVEKGVIEVRRPVVEAGPEKAQLRRGDHLPGEGAAKALLSRFVAELQLARLDRADGAEQVLIHLAALVLPAVFAGMRHVVTVADQEDQVVLLPHVDAVDDAAIEGLPQPRVAQLALAQGGEKAVLLAVHDLFGGKGDVQQVLAQRARQRLFQQRQILLLLLPGDKSHGLVDLGDDLLV